VARKSEGTLFDCQHLRSAPIGFMIFIIIIIIIIIFNAKIKKVDLMIVK